MDRLSVARGSAFGLLIGVPVALANVALASQDPKPKGLLNLTFLLLMGAFLLAGFMAGREAPTLRSQHGALAALGTYVAIQVVGVLGRLDRSEPLAIGQMIVLAFLSAFLGSLGGTLGARRPSPRRPPT